MSVRENSKPSTVEAGFPVDTKELLGAVLHKKWLILACTLFVGAAVGLGTLRQPKIYLGSAELRIEPVLPQVLPSDDEGFENLPALAKAEREFNNTQYETIQGRIVLRKAATALKLAEDSRFLADYELSGKADPLDAAVAVLTRQLTVEPQRGSRIVRVLVLDFDPERAARLANGIAQAYQDHTLESRIDVTRGASEWLDKRATEFAQRLDEQEKQIYAFKRDNLLVNVSLEDKQTVQGTRLATLNQKLVQVQTELIELRARRATLGGTGVEDLDRSEAFPAVQSSGVISNIKTTFAQLTNQRADLTTRYGPKHQAVQAIERQLADLRELLRREIGLIVAALDNEVKARESAETELKRAISEETKAELALTDLALRYTKLTREYAMTKATYEALLKRQTEADLSTTTTSNFVHWFEHAEPNPVPVKPSVPKNTAAGLAVGLLLGLLIAVGGALLDNTVHTQQDIEQGLQLTFLGLVPSIEKTTDKELSPPPSPLPSARDLYIVDNPKSALAECARSIRTNLLFMSTDRPLKRLLVTSPGPAEGKSTIAINLAVVMAQAGNKVLLVDTDLRRPRLHRTFGYSLDSGITSALLSTATAAEVIRETKVPGLDVLCCGPLPPNPAELLHADRFKRLVEELGEKYDRIVFDSPPVNAVTDSAILSQIVDGTVLVAKDSKTAKEAIRRAKRQLHSVNAHIIGVVLNDIDMEKGSSGYSYYYYRRYGYGDEKGSET